MQVSEFLGWVKSFLDTMGLTPILYGSIILGLAVFAVKRIMGDD